MIVVDDAAFTFFIGLQILLSHRQRILLSDEANIPEVSGRLSVQTFLQQQPTAFAAAQKMYQQTPRCFLRYLRLCCVSSCELAPLPPVVQAGGARVSSSGGGPDGSNSNSNSTSGARSPSRGSAATSQRGRNRLWSDLDASLAAQSVRKCVMMTANELVQASRVHVNVITVTMLARRK